MIYRILNAIKTGGLAYYSLLPFSLGCHSLDLFKDLKVGQSELVRVLDFIAGEEKDCAWIPEYPIITDLIREMGLAVGCELGVAYGGQSKYFLENTQVNKLYSVDPYQHFSTAEWNDGGNFEQIVLDAMFLKVQYALKPFGDRSVLLRETSKEASERFHNNALDFVYIDANHEYSHVLEDLSLWYSKVRSGGLVAGDDYVVWPSVALVA